MNGKNQEKWNNIFHMMLDNYEHLEEILGNITEGLKTGTSEITPELFGELATLAKNMLRTQETFLAPFHGDMYDENITILETKEKDLAHLIGIEDNTPVRFKI